MLINSTNLPQDPCPPTDSCHSWKQIGGRICNATETLVATTVALHRVCERTANSPGRVATMVLTGAAGIKQIVDGDIINGGLYAGLAVKEFFNIYGTNNNQSEVARLISDARSNVEMIETLEEANKKSIEVIDLNLDLVSQNVTKLTTQLSEIQALATHGSEELEIQKSQTCELYHEADQLFKQARAKILESQNNISDAHSRFKAALEKFEDLIDLAQSTEGDLAERLNTLVDTSMSIHGKCVEASNMLEGADPVLAEGLKLFDAAISKKDAAQFEAGRTIEMARQQQVKISEKAAVESNSQKELGIIRTEVNDIKERNAIVEDLLKEQAANLLEAQELAEADWGTASILIGGGIGALVVGAVGAAAGPGGSVAGTVAGIGVGAKAFHERTKISEFVMGTDPIPVPDAPTEKNPVTFKFNEKSSGFWGRYYHKRPSYTVGQVSINLGNNESISYGFNLNDVKRGRSPICQKDLVNLAERLGENLKKGHLTNEQCENILTQLETVEIDRGSQNKDSGFLKKTTAASKFLWNISKRIKCEVEEQVQKIKS